MTPSDSNKHLLSTIIPQNVYLDKKSIELLTGRVRRKYKLAGKPLLDKYFFNILTKTKSACKTSSTLCIESTDWDKKISGSRLNITSYCDLTKYELINKSELITKLLDKKNKFLFQAKLCDQKCIELQCLRNQVSKSFLISQEVKRIINQGLSPSIDEALSKLGLD